MDKTIPKVMTQFIHVQEGITEVINAAIYLLNHETKSSQSIERWLNINL